MSRTVPVLLDEQAARFGAREALVGGGTRLTYAQLREEVRGFAKGLYALGVRKGDHVAILMGNRPEWIVADLAACALGAVMVAVNTWVTARELCYVLAHSSNTTTSPCSMNSSHSPRPCRGSNASCTWACAGTKVHCRSRTFSRAGAW